MANTRQITDKQTLTDVQKNANDKQYYKDKIDMLDSQRNTYQYSTASYGGISDYRRMKTNYDLHNNILDREDFEYVCTPFGAEAGELPAKMTNKDISSPRIKALMGMEMKRGFKYKLVAQNREATTRIEEEQFGRINQYVISEIMRPIQERIQMSHQEELSGGKLSPQQREEIMQKIAQEVEAATPDKVKRYMERDHQDPAEVLGQHILNQVSKEQNFEGMFNQGWFHALISAYEIYYVGIINGKSVSRAMNPLRFDFDMGRDEIFLQNAEWQTYEHRLMPSELVSMFGSELTDEQINKLYSDYKYYVQGTDLDRLFDFSRNEDLDDLDGNSIKALHCVWKALRKIGFLTYLDVEGKQQMDIVSEEYKLNKDAGDIEIKWEWIPQIYEGWKVNDLYLGMQPLPVMDLDIDSLYDCPMPYYGAIYDNVNSQATSPMDRMKHFQYYHNIVMYRLELLLASDDGKKILLNINAIPESAGIDIEQWQYFFKSTNIGWINPNEEGVSYNDVNSLAKEIDLSTASDMNKYIELAMYLDKKCGQAVGVTDPVLGEISPSQEVGNTKQQLIQTSHILEPYFNLHNQVKRMVTEAALNNTRMAWYENPPEYLSYVLDDLSRHLVGVDELLLRNSKLGLFIENSSKSEETRDAIRGLAHAAMQTEKAELSDVIAIIRQDGIQESEEILRVGEKKRIEREDTNAKLERESKERLQQSVHDFKREEWQTGHKNKMAEIAAKGSIDLQKQAMLSIGFNEDKDLDNDGKLDVLEVYEKGVKAQIEERKVKLDESKHQEQVRSNKAKEKIETKKIAAKNK